MSKRSQAAMEYLMTYGWSILIIAVVLGALAYLGVFNPNTYAPRAPPGSCKIFKAGGNTNLEGVCNGEMPQYVVNMQDTSLVGMSANPVVTPPSITVSAWVYMSNAGTCFTNCKISLVGIGNIALLKDSDVCGSGQSASNLEFGFRTANAITNDWVDGCGFYAGQWYDVVGVYSPGTATSTLYVNGAYKNSHTGTFNPPLYYSMSYAPTLGGLVSGSGSSYSLADVQVYNASLDANSVMALYKEGIGGAPINTANLVAWWPLNGDVNDYSGNNNNGVPANVAFTNQWMSGYSTPPH